MVAGIVFRAFELLDLLSPQGLREKLHSRKNR